MSALQESICDAMSILTNSAIQHSNATITLECKIIDILDAALGLYKVEYLGNQFEVYSNPTVIYNIDDIVYVLVPDGDMDKTKTIISGVTPSASMYITDSPSDNYIPISDNLLWNIGDINLCTYHSEEKNIPINNILEFNTIMQDYLENYKTYLFSAKIKTNIPLDQQQGGNYGLILSLPFLKISNEDGEISSPIWKTVSIDINTIQGNPYRLNEYSLQNIYFQAESGEVYDTTNLDTRVPHITAFVKDFAQDPNEKPYDIFIKNIELKAIEQLTVEEKQGYNLTIIASEGNYFFDNVYSSQKTLTPVLKINGKDKNIKSYDCYWFVEDSSIMPTSEGYSSLGGIGWKCLNERTNVDYNEDGRLTYQYVTNNYALKVNQADVTASLRYKCVLVYNDVIINGVIQLKNLNANIIVELVSATGSNNYVKDIGYVSLIGRVYYPGLQAADDDSLTGVFDTAWQRFDKNGNYLGNNFYEFVRKNISVTDNKGRVWYETEIKFPCSTIEQYNTIHCTFYSNILNKDNEVIRNILGTNSILISAIDNYNYKLTIQNGDIVYKYDADGDSPKSADYDGPLTSVVKKIQPLSFKIYKNDGSELTETEYLYCRTTWRVPKNSLIKLSSQYKNLEDDDNYYYIKGQGQIEVYYDILNSYNVKKNDSSIFLTVEFNDNVLNEVVNIKFLKDGESGTNGSKYTAIVQYNGYGYGERDSDGDICKLHCISVRKYHIEQRTDAAGEIIDVAVYDDDKREWGLLNYKTGLFETWNNTNNPRFDVAVYCDGELITDSTKYTVSWSLFDSLSLPTDFQLSRGILSKKDDLTYPENAVIAQAKITVGNIGTTNSQEVIYAYYPIETTFVTTSQEIYGSIIPSIEGGFDKVIYASDGTNPKYDNTNAFEYNDNLSNETDEVKEYYDYIWESLSENLDVDKEDDTSSAYFKAKTKFDNGMSNNGIKLTLIPKDNLITRVKEKLNQLNIEIAQLRAEEYYYDGIIINLKQLLEQFNYDNYFNKLDEIKQFLTCRYNLIVYVNQLQNALNDIHNYCVSQEIDENTYISPIIIVEEEEEISKPYYSTLTNIFNQLRINLYNLGKEKTIEWDKIIYNLNNADINIINIDGFKEKYGIAIYTVLESFIISYMSILTNYRGIRNEIVNDDDLEKLNKIEQNLINIVNSDELKFLSSDYENFGATIHAEAEYIILKEQLAKIVALLWSVEDQCNNFDGINERILKEFQKIFVKYKDSYYEVYYRNKIDLAVAAIQIKVAQSKDYGKIIFEGFPGDIITHIKPIVMLFNRYEMSNINGWDGSKLYIDETHEDPQYLLAPQVGAGLKKEGTFTGVVMGIKKFNDKSSGSTVTKNHIGLFGFSGGQQTYFMNSRDGSVIMGKSGNGQIIIDPREGVQGGDKALLYSSNFWKDTAYGDDGKPKSYSEINENGQGMLIDLTTPEIRFGTGNFVVNPEGHITAKGGGTIGGWRISDTTLYSNVSEANGRITLDSGIIIDEETGETIYTKGKIYSGLHKQINSTLDGFYLSDEGLSIGSKVYIGKDGVMKLGNGAVASVSDPIPTRGLRAITNNFWTINGDSTGSYISYNTTSYQGSDSGGVSVYLGTKGISTGGSTFWVNQQGEMHSQSGDIGTWQIKTDSITSPDGTTTILGSDGSITCKNLIAKTDGSIGGWHISDTELSNNDLHLYGNGRIYCDGGFDLDKSGLSLTGGSISIGNFTLSANTLDAIFSPSNLKIGNKDTNQAINVYVDEIVAKKIKAEMGTFLKTYGGELSCNTLTVKGKQYSDHYVGTVDQISGQLVYHGRYILSND